ncbi:MAG: glycosyltransferase family 4 protein, partial [Nitrospirota bacterium]
MKILFTSNGYPPREAAGAELYTYNLAGALSGRHSLNVFCRTVDRSMKEYAVIREVSDGVGVARMVNNLSGALQPVRYYSDVKADCIFEEYLCEIRPDIVHVQHLMGLSGGFLRIVKEAGIPLVVTLHDYWFICPRFQLIDESGLLCRGPEGGSRCAKRCPNSLFSVGPDGFFGAGARIILKYMPAGLQRKLKQMVRDGVIKEIRGISRSNIRSDKFIKRAEFLKKALLKADKIISPSGYARDIFVENGFPPEKITVIPHGIPLPACKPARRGVKVRFGYMGSLAQLKGVSFLVEAFGRLCGEAELHIYGHGGENQDIILSGLKKLAKDACVTFHGRYAFDDMGVILAGIDVLVIPSLWPETFNIVMREAFACGVPVIASDAGALPEGVNNG